MYLNQYIVEETNVSKPMYSWGNQYLNQYSCGNQCKFEEPNVYLNKPVYKGANPCTLDQTDLSKPIYCICLIIILLNYKPMRLSSNHTFNH